MKLLYIDANIILNIWRQEKDSNGKELWKGSSELIEKVELGEYQGIMGLTTVMEILHAVRVRALEKNLNWQDMVSKAIDRLKR
jgi:hypothetical protein